MKVMNSSYNKIYTSLAAFLMLLCSVSSTEAQQERYLDERGIPIQGFIHPILLNPGATASSGDQNLLLNYRSNWAGFGEAAPKTITLSYDGRIADRLGFGAMFLQDNYGALQLSKGQVSFSYNIESPTNVTSFGLSTEYIQHKLNNGDVDDVIIDREDPLFQARRAGAEFFDVSFGIFGKYDKKITYGLALPSLISSRLDSDGADQERDLGFILQLGYLIRSQSTGIDFEPSMIVKKLNRVPTHVDLNLRMGFLEDKFQSGLTYSIGADKRLGFLIGVKIDRLDLFYVYNTSMQDFQQYNNGGHELSARFSLGSDKKKKDSMMTKDPMLESGEM